MVSDHAPTARADPTVAIVDDDEAILSALARLVRTLGYSTRTFQTAEALLRGMGYAITPQIPWGAVEMIAVGLEKTKRTAASSGGDSARSGRMWPGWFYGSNDPRRPAGAAVGR